MIRVLCFGTFDGLHAGHDAFLRQAVNLGEEVWVVISRDVTVVHVKGQLPAINQEDRLKAVQAHPAVTEARLGHVDDKYQVIDEIRPQIILLGYDQQAFTDKLQAELDRRGHAIEIRRAKPYQADWYKTSKLRPPPLIVQIPESEDGFPL
jgi:FAD synthetase